MLNLFTNLHHIKEKADAEEHREDQQSTITTQEQEDLKDTEVNEENPQGVSHEENLPNEQTVLIGGKEKQIEEKNDKKGTTEKEDDDDNLERGREMWLEEDLDVCSSPQLRSKEQEKRKELLIQRRRDRERRRKKKKRRTNSFEEFSNEIASDTNPFPEKVVILLAYIHPAALGEKLFIPVYQSKEFENLRRQEGGTEEGRRHRTGKDKQRDFEAIGKEVTLNHTVYSVNTEEKCGRSLDSIFREYYEETKRKAKGTKSVDVQVSPTLP